MRNEENIGHTVLGKRATTSLSLTLRIAIHCVKSVQIRGFLWSLFSFVRTESRKIRTRKNFVFEHFSRSVLSVLIYHLSRETTPKNHQKLNKKTVN